MERSDSVSSDVVNRKRVAVIGSGIGGMCAAARLAKAGYEIYVYESANRHGGKCRTEWIGDYAFDTGPSLLTLPAVYRDFFQKTGEVMGRVLELEAVEPAFDYRFADGKEIKFANLSRKSTLAAIEKSLGSAAAVEWDTLMRRAELMWDVSREPFIESELRSITSLFKRPTFLRDLKIIAPWKSLRGLQMSDPHLRNILDRYATYSGSDPRVAPAVLASIAFVEEAFGAWHIKGGVGKLADAVYQRCLDKGVSFEFNSPVIQINHDGKKTTGITLGDGRNLNFDLVIANADAKTIYSKLLSNNSRKVKREGRKIAKADPSLAGFSLLIGLKPSSQDSGLSHHTIFFPKDYDQEFEDIFKAQIPVQNPTIYICAPKDEFMVKTAGHESWFLLVNAPPHDVKGVTGFNWSDSDVNHRYAMHLLDLLEERGILIRDRIEVLEIRTPADLERTVLAPGGSIYGTASNNARSTFQRAKNRSPLPGLYCVGGSAHPGGGLPLVGLSAEIVAQAITGKANH